MDNGFIKLHRKILEWGWYDHIPTRVLFFHLLIRANWKDKVWRSIDIKRGSILTSYDTLSNETGLSRQQVRTAVSNLLKTKDINTVPTSRYTIIEVNNYDDYQSANTALTQCQHNNNTVPTQSQQAVNIPSTPTKEVKEIKKVRKKEEYSSAFEDFWSLYPKKRNKVKSYAEWKKIKPDEFLIAEIMLGLSKLKDSHDWNKDGGKYIVHPERFIRDRRWEDEPVEHKPMEYKSGAIKLKTGIGF